MLKSFFPQKMTAFFVCLVTVFYSLSMLICAEDKLSPIPDTSGASHIYLYNYESDSIVYSKGSHQQRIAPASTVKLMSGYLALKNLSDRLDENIEITSEMLRGVEGFTVGIKVGDVLSINDILYSLICGSGNDAAHIVAHLCCGSIEEFVNEMNSTALNLGMKDTNYVNPTGLDDNDSYTTVSDTATISKINAQNELFIKLSTTSKYTYTPLNSDTPRNIYNRNALHSTFSASGYKSNILKGLNAGSTDKGGYCVSAYTSDGQDSYLCIIMGGEYHSNENIASYKIANELTEYFLNNYTYTKVAKKGDIISNHVVELALPVNGYNSVYVNSVIDRDIYAYAPKNIDYNKDLTYKVYYHTDRMTAPISQGTVLGGVDIYFQDQLLASAKIVSDTDITESKLLLFLDSMKRVIISRTSIIFIVLLIPSILIFLYFTKCKSIKRRNIIK